MRRAGDSNRRRTGTSLLRCLALAEALPKAHGLLALEEVIRAGGDRTNRETLQSRMPFSDLPVGVFSGRSPNRPNPIAFGLADLIRLEDHRLVVRGVDALDGSPLLDIKAYALAIDAITYAASGSIPTSLEGISEGKLPHA